MSHPHPARRAGHAYLIPIVRELADAADSRHGRAYLVAGALTAFGLRLAAGVTDRWPRTD